MNLSNFTPVLTGPAAARSVQDRMSRNEVEKDQDAQWPLNARRTRRGRARIDARQQKKGQQAYVRRQLLVEQVQRDLAHQFAILDRIIPSSPSAFDRVVTSLAEKQRVLAEQQDISAEDAHRRLREMAANAR